ncbi:phage distal tail protein [Streptomyces olivaceiscleroticus]|uniref:Siphovirus-type tail component C-terminal domain-containing protein n=1 Tax=Streptomyces olivaceiscleroticus TaxID=68245 RepID=A0ABN1BLG7_9ACTN
MTTPIELEDGQHQLGPVLIGKGTPISIAEFEGLGMASQRTGDVEPPGADGLWLGADYYSGRTLHLDAAVKVAGNPSAVLDQLAALQEAVDDPAVRGQGGTTMDFRLKFPGRPVRVVRGRLRKAEPLMAQYLHGWAPLDLEFQAADHAFYDDAFDVTTIPLGMLTTGGLTFPLQFPFVINGDPAAVGRPGYLQVDGTAPTWPVLRVTGPCANPSITHVGSGRTLSVQTTLAAGEWVEIDCRPGWRTVLRENGGGVPLTPQSRIDLFQLTPGINEIRWTATDNTLTSSLAVAWWPAYKAL